MNFWSGGLGLRAYGFGLAAFVWCEHLFRTACIGAYHFVGAVFVTFCCLGCWVEGVQCMRRLGFTSMGTIDP